MATWAVFGGRACQDPGKLADALREGDPPAPTDWLDLPIRYACPVGLSPGRGHVLLLKSDLDRLDLSGKHKLELGEDTLGTSVTFPNMRVVGHPRCLDLGAPDPCYLVEIADRRADLLAATNKRYEWRYHPTDPTPVTGTTAGSGSGSGSNSDTSWAAVIEALWPLLPLGTFPGWPTAAPTPTARVVDRADLHGVPIRDAIDQGLAALGCGVAYDPIRDTFSIVYFPTSEDKAPAVRKRYVCVYDENPYVPRDYGPVPGKVCVTFPVWRAGRSDREPRLVYVKAVDRPVISFAGGTTLESASKVGYLQDFTPARCHAEELDCLNESQLSERATQVARIWYDRFADKAARGPVRQAFSGLLDDLDVRPGGTYDLVAWSITTAGPVTAVARSGMAATVPLYTDTPTTGLTATLPSAFLPATGTTDVPRRAGGLLPSPDRTREAPRQWVSVAGEGAGPLFQSAAALRQLDWQALPAGLWRNWEDPPRPDDMVRFVKVTGALVYPDLEGDGGSGSGSGGGTPVYPAVVVQQIGSYSDWYDEEPCYLESTTGARLVVGRPYLARAAQTYVPGQSGSGGGRMRVWATSAGGDSCVNVVLTGKDYQTKHPSILYSGHYITESVTNGSGSGSAEVVYDLGDPFEFELYHLQNVALPIWDRSALSGSGSGSAQIPADCVHRACPSADGGWYYVDGPARWEMVAISGNTDADGVHPGYLLEWSQADDEVVALRAIEVIDINAFV